MSVSRGKLGLVDVNGSSDPVYRYKMHLPLCVLEKGKTLIENLPDIGKTLRRNPKEILQFLGCELNTQSTCKAKHNKYYVKGNHSDKIAQKILQYVEMFVLCPLCGNPETHYKIKKIRIFVWSF